MKKITPYIGALAFCILLVSNNAISNWKSTRLFRGYETIDEPLRKIIANDELLSDEKDAKIFVINLWATWCQPCQHEIPHLNKLVDKYEQEGILFIAINGEKKEKVLKWMDLQKNEYIYFQLFNQKSLMKYLFQLNPDETYKAGQKPEHMPTNLIIKNNELVYFKSGYSKVAIEDLDKTLSNIIHKLD